MEIVKASAPGKVILFGEHAVVYGVPAIAIPVHDARVTVVAQDAPLGSGIVLHNVTLRETWAFDPAVVNANPVSQIIGLVLHAANVQPPDLSITIDSSIPVASGLGSGAAVSAAVGDAVAQSCGVTLDREQLNALVYEIEKQHHGTPSGIDNTVIVYQQPIFFRREHPIEPISVLRPITFLVVDTGCSATTKQVVADVRRLRETQPRFTQTLLTEIEALVNLAHTALSEGDHHLLGNLMTQNHRLLQSLTVSSYELDHLVNVALDAGAYGAKLSGGGRGGNMIVLSSEDRLDDLSTALLEAGAVRVLRANLSP
jgi:mevalonate kinase